MPDFNFNPRAHYWLATDGRLFSGPLQEIVTTADAAYVTWIAEGHFATGWPKDEIGQQTDEALIEVLRSFGMNISNKAALIDYAASVRYAKEIGGITWNGASIKTDRDSQALVTGLRCYAQDNPSESVSFIQDGIAMTLTSAQALLLFTAIAQHVQAARATEADVAAQIASGTITTKAGVDAAFAV